MSDTRTKGACSHGVVLVGARGRMGRWADTFLGVRDDFHVLERVGSKDDLSAVLGQHAGALCVDFTVAGRGFAHAALALEHGLRPLVGTSGVGPEQVRELDRLACARHLGGLVVPHFGIGMALLLRAARQVAALWPEAEIVELHHDKKRDAPSGTALHAAAQLALVTGRDASATPIHSVRLAGLYAHHELHFGAPGEHVTLRHDTTGPEAFGPGFLYALAHAVSADGVLCGLEHVLPDAQPPSEKT